jgi:mannose-6-phosphate isomerase-like protein (cupin superfamily)
VLAAGARDNQKPHNQDEIYYVLRGKAKMQLGLREVNVAPGQLIYVAAREEHSFHTIEEELSLLVMFAPAESD